VRWAPAWELVSWSNERVVRQPAASKEVKTEAEEATALKPLPGDNLKGVNLQ
jgi:hypothetical protein